MDLQTDVPSPRDPETGVTIQNRTSFLIEDILYRQKSNQDDGERLYEPREIQNIPPFKSAHQAKIENIKAYAAPNKSLEKRQDKGTYSYFQSNMVQGGCIQGFQQSESGYIQVMGALGAYLGTPYKSIPDPYFLTQGKCWCKYLEVIVS